MESNNPITSKQMEHVRKYERRDHAVLKMGNDLRPADGEGCVGKAGIDKTYTFDKVLALAYRMPGKPNIIIKAGRNAKWYIKKCATDEIDREIEKTKNQVWGKTKINMCTMHIIEWDE